MGVELLVEGIELWIVARERRLDRFLEGDDVEFGVGGQQGRREQGGGCREGSDKSVHD
jgi:hypothetical protein